MAWYAGDLAAFTGFGSEGDTREQLIALLVVASVPAGIQGLRLISFVL